MSTYLYFIQFKMPLDLILTFVYVPTLVAGYLDVHSDLNIGRVDPAWSPKVAGPAKELAVANIMFYSHHPKIICEHKVQSHSRA
jgi:hypothetical protein